MCVWRGAGKTSLVIQLTQSHFIDDYDPTTEDSYRKRVTIDDETCLLDILDGCYESVLEYSAIWDAYLRAANGIILVYSITWRHSFDQIIPMLQRINASYRAQSSIPLAVVLVANKCDLDAEGLRVVSAQEGQELAQSIGASFFETSAKERIHIEDVFFEAVRTTRALQSLHETTAKSKSPKKCVVT
jgi:GTPase KRas